MNRRHFIRAGSGLACAAIAPAVHAWRAEPILLGQSAALSGPSAALGTEFRRGAMLVFDRVNAGGGIGGRPIELVSLDDGYEPERCERNTSTLIDRGALALFGYVGTPTSLAALPMAASSRVCLFAPFTGAEALRAPSNRYAFHIRGSYYDETERIVRQLATVGIRRIGVFHQNDSYGRAGLEGVLRGLSPLGLQPVCTGTVERNSSDVSSALDAILAGKPDAIIQISAYRSCAAFVRAAKRAGYGGMFYNVSFVGTQALADELGPDARGVVVSQVMPFPYAPTTVIAGEYLAAGRVSEGIAFAPNYSGIEGYIAATTMVRALRRAKGATRAGIVGALESLHEVDLGGFVVDFAPGKHVASKFVELTILTSDGRVRR
ncbi:MAG TPA: ABC transporter substrate-binding protein [Albitalea sp.]|uniref:ABC transporter substrate-binding protein n=1 Tax=Piscinibacter sp. TaxID=1903157 RepID=UPI002ED39696